MIIKRNLIGGCSHISQIELNLFIGIFYYKIGYFVIFENGELMMRIVLAFKPEIYKYVDIINLKLPYNEMRRLILTEYYKYNESSLTLEEYIII